MYLEYPENVTPEQIREDISGYFYAYTVKPLWLNKKTILVSEGISAATVAPHRGKLRLTPTPNTQHPGVLAAIVIGVLFGFILAVLVIGVVYAISNTKNKEIEQQLADFLMEKYGIVQVT